MGSDHRRAGSGKTTICDELIKAGHRVVPEASRGAILEAQGRGFSSEEIFADRKLLANAIWNRKLEIARGLSPSERCVWDTGLVDSLVFCRLADCDLSRIEPAGRIYRYRSVALLEPLAHSRIIGDPVRPQTAHERILLHESLVEEYGRQKYQATRVGDGSIGDRLRAVLGA